MSFGGGANNTQGYTVNGIRSSGNTVSLDGSSLIDIGSNSGVIVTLNNDMVQEVKVQSSNFAAEYGTGGMNVSGVTKSGHARSSTARSTTTRATSSSRRTIARTASPARRSRRASTSIRAATSAVRSSFGDSYTKNRDKLFFFVAFEVQRQQVDSGSRFTPHLLAGDAQRRLQRAARQPRLEPEQHSAAADPAGLPERGPAGAEQRHAAVHHAARASTWRACTRCPNYNDPNNLYNYVYSRLEPTNRTDFKSRFDWNISNSTKAYVRVAREGETTKIRAACGGARPTSRCRRRTSATNNGRSFAGNVVSVLSPSMTNEALVSYSRLALDNHFKDPSVIAQGAGGVTFNGIFPAGTTSPYLPTDLLHGWGGSGQVGNLWAAANDVYAHNDCAAVQRQADQADRRRTA